MKQSHRSLPLLLFWLEHGGEALLDTVKMKALVHQKLARARHEPPAVSVPPASATLAGVLARNRHAEKGQQRLGEERRLNEVGGPGALRHLARMRPGAKHVYPVPRAEGLWCVAGTQTQNRFIIL